MLAAEHYAGVLGRFGKLRLSYTGSGRGAWYTRCPVCQDKCPTHLRIWVGDSGKLHAKCFGGQCKEMSRAMWWAALLGVTDTKPAEWFPANDDRPTRGRRVTRDSMKIVATYDYRDEKGRLLYQCVKFAKGSPQKCAYRRPAFDDDDPKAVRVDDKGLRWVWDGAGRDPDKYVLGEIVPARAVLYRLPELLAADPRHPVLICEGEPDVESLRALGFISVSNPHGGSNWPDDLGADCLPGRRCVLFEDNNLAGRRHCRSVGGLLLSLGVLSLRLVRFREFPEKFDITDWLRQTRFPEMPESGLAAAWLSHRTPKELADARKAVAELCKYAPEWSPLTAAEQKARLAALNKPADERSRTLEEALADQQGEAA